MALTIGYNQQSLHSSSQRVMDAAKGSRTWPQSTDWQAPAFRTARTIREDPVIPAPSIFQSLADTKSNCDTGANSTPSVAECAVHLELLQVLRTLRARVLQSTDLDNAFNIKPIPRYVTRRRRQVKAKDHTFEMRRKEKWPMFIEHAVVRFEDWFERVDSMLASNILMVWHSYLLNPKSFQTYCEVRRRNTIRHAAFPWLSIHNAINTSDWSFNLPGTAREWYRNNTNKEPDLFQYLVYYRGGRVLDTVRYLSTNVELSSAVKRQESFVDKMDGQLWIRSPGLKGTLQRAQSRYEKFLKLFKWYPNTLLVPTLDIDLVWHTHQLSPSQYRTATVELAGKFIDHDDKLGAPTLDNGMEKTSQLFRIRFGEEYQICTCWDCEALLSAVDGREQGDASVDGDSVSDQVAIDVAYHRAVELARRKKTPLPIRDN